jgi:hypothetical protein
MRLVHDRQLLWASLGAAACLTLTAACTTLRPATPDQLRGPHPPDRVRVTEANGSTVILHSPQLVGDSLGGWVDGERRTFLLSPTTEIEVRAAAPDRTSAAIIFGGGLAALGYLVIGASTKASACNGKYTLVLNPGCSCCDKPIGPQCVC